MWFMWAGLKWAGHGRTAHVHKTERTAELSAAAPAGMSGGDWGPSERHTCAPQWAELPASRAETHTVGWVWLHWPHPLLHTEG